MYTVPKVMYRYTRYTALKAKRMIIVLCTTEINENFTYIVCIHDKQFT